SPPIPVIIGSTTDSTAAAVTAASIALPPCCSTVSAALVASGWLVAATPFGAYTGDLPAIVGVRCAARGSASRALSTSERERGRIHIVWHLPPRMPTSRPMSLTDIGRLRQSAIYIRGLAGERPRVPTQPEALEQRARAVMTRRGFAYVAGGAGAEMTMRANREAFERWRLVPRVLRNVERRDCSIELFGRTLPAPVLLAPVGVLEMAHPDADLAVARAAAALGVPMIFSSQASVAMETCAGVMGQSPRWFQLYWSRMDALMESFVRRAERCGCEAIVLTVDTMTLGWRPRDLDLGS